MIVANLKLDLPISAFNNYFLPDKYSYKEFFAEAIKKEKKSTARLIVVLWSKNYVLGDAGIKPND
jgi:hypothetical protein